MDTYGDPLPQGVVRRMGTVRLRHPDAAIEFSRDGKTLISAGSSGDVRYWETATGKEIRRIQLQRTGKRDAHIRGHKLSADGKVFGCWEQGEDAFTVYDAATGKQPHRFSMGAVEWGWVLCARPKCHRHFVPQPTLPTVGSISKTSSTPICSPSRKPR
jgi:WD40 repeat protein